MKINKYLSLPLFLFTLICSSLLAQVGDPGSLEPGLSNRTDIVFFGGFEEYYNNYNWKRAWGIPWTNRTSNNKVVDNAFAGGKSLAVYYPAGGVGPQETGTQFPMKFSDMVGMSKGLYQELYLRYYVKFNKDFDFKLGGKLPGLMGGGDSWSRSGGNQPDGSDGWTLRFMWREDGRIVVYAYVPRSTNGKLGGGQWGQEIDCGFYAERGKWHCIEQYVNVGTPGNNDGQLKVWIDSIERINITDMRFWNVENDNGPVGGIYFSTFHGGNTEDWAPASNSVAMFDGIVAARKRVGMHATATAMVSNTIDPYFLRVYPNPVQEHGTLSYTLDERDEHISIEIYDTQGRLRDVIFHGSQDAGEHNLILNTAHLNQGVYFVRMTTSNATRSIKLIIEN